MGFGIKNIPYMLIQFIDKFLLKKVLELMIMVKLRFKNLDTHLRYYTFIK